MVLSEKCCLMIEHNVEAGVRFSLLYSLQYSSSLMLRGTLPTFEDPSCKGFDVPRDCCKRYRHIQQTSTCDGAGGSSCKDRSHLWPNRLRRRARWDAGPPNPQLHQTHQHLESLPLPLAPCESCHSNYYTSGSRYEPMEARGSKREWAATRRDFLVGQQPPSNVSPIQLLHDISWISTTLKYNYFISIKNQGIHYNSNNPFKSLFLACDLDLSPQCSCMDHLMIAWPLCTLLIADVIFHTKEKKLFLDSECMRKLFCFFFFISLLSLHFFRHLERERKLEFVFLINWAWLAFSWFKLCRKLSKWE